MNTDSRVQDSLVVIYNGDAVFRSQGHWLHPLFDLEDFLRTHPIDMGQAQVQDKIVGRGAALLMLHMGAGQVHGDIMSELAIEALRQAGVPHSFRRSVERITCETETILQEVLDPGVAHSILCERAGRC